MQSSLFIQRRHAALLAAIVAGAVGQRASGAQQVGDVFVIAMENHNWTQPGTQSSPQQILGNPAAPYINSLVTPGNANAAQVSYASNYTNAGIGVHPSEPNYVWAEAGTDFGVHTDADPGAASNGPYNTPHLTSLMNSAGVSWNNYQEDYQISGNGPAHSANATTGGPMNPYYGTTQYNYAAKHNPMVFFADTQTQNVKSFDELRSDITNNNFARYNWITPNQFNDMHSAISGTFTYHGTAYTGDQSAVATGDNFLATIVPQIMATQAYQNNGAIVLWWDESEGGDDPSRTVPEIVISPLAKGNAYSSTVSINHSSDIKTMQEIFGLGPDYLNNTIPSGETAASGVGFNTVGSVNDLSDLFQGGVIPSTLVPEPASLALLALCGLPLLGRRRAR